MEGDEMSGQTLIDQVVSETGLPADQLTRELVELLESAGITPETASLDELRLVLTEYVQDILVQAKEVY
jgi:hypothetical protein